MNLLALPKDTIREIRNRHLLIWCLITVYYFVFYSLHGPVWAKSISTVVHILNNAWSYYVLLLFTYPKILGEKKPYYVFQLMAVFLLFLMIHYFQMIILLPWFEGAPLQAGVSFYNGLGKASLAFLFPLCASMATYLNWRGLKRMEEEATRDKEAAEKEFQFLKSQFHSPFIFSFLHFCNVKIKNISPVTAHSVEDFSGMLRYALIAPSDKPVSLEKEVQYIENFIAFHKNLTNDLHINFTCEGDIKKVYILPRILIVFIENAVKHGIIHDPLNPIVITVKVEGKGFVFSIKNKNSHRLKMEESGIGLRNMKQILQLFYPGCHALTISQMDDAFFCRLQLYNLKELEI